jgi:hypothetical protein
VSSKTPKTKKMRDLSNNGVQFTTLNDTSRRGQVSGYHSKPDPIFRTKATAQDVSGLKSVEVLMAQSTRANSKLVSK